LSFREALETVKRSTEIAIKKSGFPKTKFEPSEPSRVDFGDISVNVSFVIANALSLKPMEVAKKITENLTIPKESLLSDLKIWKPGYINFKIDYGKFAYRTLKESVFRKSYGAIDLGHKTKVCVEHTSVNPNKALHIGHARNLILGDSIYRILKFTNHDVRVLNYIDDSGVQIADLVIAFKYVKIPINPQNNKKFDHYCGDVYANITSLYKSKPDLELKKKEVLREIEEGKSELAGFAREITKKIMENQLKTCWRMGAHYDCLNYESQILETKLWEKTFTILKDKKMAYLVTDGKLAGCWVIKFEDEEKVLVRSDGTVMYIAKDIPYAGWKIGLVQDPFQYDVFTKQPDDTELWHTTTRKGRKKHPPFNDNDLAITVIDVRQSLLQRIISYALPKLGEKKIQKKYIHLPYEIVVLSKHTAKELDGDKEQNKNFIQMSGREGIYFNVDDVLEILKSKAYEETKKRNPDENNKWYCDTAEKVAIAALKFGLVKQDLDKIVVFDLNESLNLEGETGPYLQYAHARTCGILKKANFKPRITFENMNVLIDHSELNLIKLISKFDLYIDDAVRNLSPKAVARYAYTLATAFNVFYEKNPVLHEKEVLKKNARLSLVVATKNVLKRSLNLLGIESPERI
jgi:arginyl-tRNA synthetase